MTSPFHAQVDAALDGLRGIALGDLEPGALLLALRVLGDALRLGVDVPTPALRAAEALPDAAFRAAFRALVEETATWTLPVEPGPDEDYPTYDWAIRRRDEAESVVVAARRILVPRGTLLDELEEARAFDATIMLRDFTCGGRRWRADAERALGERVALATPGSWVEELPELGRGEETAEGAGAATDGAEEAARESLPAMAPSDESVDAYITGGVLVVWVEGAAQRSPAFAEELEAMIDAGLACHATVGLTARRWLRARKGLAGPARPLSHEASGRVERAPIRIAAVPPLRLAAADTDDAILAPQRIVELGTLYPLDVVAHLMVSAEAATLRVSPAAGLTVRRVQFGSAVALAADAEGFWRVTTPNTGEPLDLRVEAADGRVFEETVALDPAESP
jgi:hypothetical protein